MLSFMFTLLIWRARSLERQITSTDRPTNRITIKAYRKLRIIKLSKKLSKYMASLLSEGSIGMNITATVFIIF